MGGSSGLWITSGSVDSRSDRRAVRGRLMQIKALGGCEIQHERMPPLRQVARAWARSLAAILAVAALGSASAAPASPPLDLWALANAKAEVHRFSTLFTAQDVRDQLSSEEGLGKAIAWCKQTGVTRAYVESYRDGYQAEAATLRTAKERLAAAGLIVSGCITPTGIGKASSNYRSVSCYTDLPTQSRVQSIFEFTARLFDEIMIDDFWFTDCACPECDSARQRQSVQIGAKSYPVDGATWEAYRCELMVRLSQDRVLAASKAVNPRARLIIKYPQWYDQFHERGYEIIRETASFDVIWVGTESRDYNDPRWGGTPQYESFFIMRWLGGVGADKCGGGWYDWLGTTEKTYVEQARQTVLGGARESMLFCYGGLQGTTGPKNVQALRAALPELLEVAEAVRSRQLVGVAAYKPANSHPENERRIFDFVGMLGIPLTPGHEFPTNAPAAFFSVHALKDSAFVDKLARYLETGKPVLLTDGLAQKLEGKLNLRQARVLAVRGDPKSLLALSPAEAQAIREPLLRALGWTFDGPGQVAFYPFLDGSWVVENFNDTPVDVRLNGRPMTVGAREWTYQWKR